MKRMIVAIAAAVMIVTPVLAATDLEVMIYGHNTFSSITGAAELAGEPTVFETKDKTKTIYYFTVNGVDVGFIVKDGTVKSCYCRATEESIGEFLSQSASVLYNICGTESLSYWYPNLLDQFLTARSGETSDIHPFIENICAFEITKENGLYQMIAAKLY